MLKRSILLLGGLYLILSTGCAAQKAFPLAARAGDTVSIFLGVGGFKTMSTDTSTVEMYPVSDPGIALLTSRECDIGGNPCPAWRSISSSRISQGAERSVRRGVKDVAHRACVEKFFR